MFKVKQKISSILVACLAALFAFVLALGVFSVMPKVTANAAETITASKTVAELITEYGWTTSTTKQTFNLDENVTVKVNGGSNSGKAYDGDHIRIYATDTPAGTLTISVPEGYELVSVKVTCVTGTYAFLYVDGSTTDISNVKTTVSGSSVVLNSVKNGSNGKQVRVTAIEVEYKEASSSEPTCEHTSTELTWVYDSSSKEHYQQCECGAEIENTRTACSEFDYSAYTTENGTHERTLTCNLCGGEQTESGECSTTTWSEWKPNEGSHVATGNCDVCNAQMRKEETCEIDAEYVRNGNEHTQIGTCTICGDSTSVTEACTLTYAYVSNDNKTHNTTSSCSVCNESVITENVACTFGEPVLDENFIYTYTCEYCEYSYTEEATMYTISYSVAGNITETVEVADGYATKLITAAAADGYTFVGWTTAPLDEKTETAPEFFKEGDDYEVTEDVTLYALYTYSEGTGAFTLVKDVANLAVGKEIVIAASGSNDAIGTNQASNNRTAVVITKSSDTITWTTAVQVITLEAGKTTGTWAFHVTGGTGTNAANGYLYAPANGNYLRTQTSITNNSSWNISITSAGVATIKANVTSGQNWLRKNSNSTLFSCYTSGQNDVSIYMKDGATYYVTAFNTCAHSNVNEVVEEATCTESGSRTVTCLDCEAVIEAEILPALGHNFIDDVCENCGKQDPASIVYDGYYYLSVNGKYAGEKDGNYYKLFDTIGENDELNYVFYFVKNDDNTYDMYNWEAGLIKAGVTIETQDDYAVHIVNDEGKILSHNTGYTTYQRLGFYATSSNYPCNITLTPVELPAKIEGSQVTLGDDIKANIYVSINEAFAENATLQYTLDGKDYTIEEYTQVGDKYVFTFIVLPQCMANEFELQLVIDGNVLDTVKYSVKAYAQTILDDTEDEYSDEAKALVSEMLRYGAAAQTYKGYNPENLVTNGVNMTAENTEAIDDNQFALETEEVEVCYAYFTGANVLFNDVNQLAVKVSSTENVTISITKQGEAESEAVAITSTTVLTEGIVATEFDTVYVFKLYYNGELMQTLTYSINSYCVRTLASTTTSDNMKALATATYYYGLAADVYAQSLQG